MSTLYHWNSTYLQRHSQGDIIVLAADETSAREVARTAFENDLKERYDWLYWNSDAEDEDEQELIFKLRQKFEADIAKDPTKVQSSAVFIAGSD